MKNITRWIAYSMIVALTAAFSGGALAEEKKACASKDGKAACAGKEGKDGKKACSSKAKKGDKKEEKKGDKK